MTGFLVDTNIPSELTRAAPDPRVSSFLRLQGKDSMFLSVLTIGEIRKGISSLDAGQKRTTLEKWLAEDVRAWFAGRILPVTESIAERWGSLAAVAKQKGSGLAVVDGLIAATELEHDLRLVTRNVRDFVGLGIDVVNPWDQ